MKAKVFGLDTIDKPNINGRIYPKDVLKKALKVYNEQFVKERRAMMVNDAPETGVINLQNVVGLVTKTELKNHALYVYMEPLNIKTNNSKELWKLFKKKKLMVCMAGLGSATSNPNGTATVREDLEILTFYFSPIR